jgi:cell wall-associated NlpC family hydrolase
MHRFILFLFIFIGFNSFSQDKKIDKLEVLYAQKHYTKVLRKSNALLANPEYDYSGMPSFYKSLALFKLSKDQVWFKRHNNSITEAIKLYQSVLEFKESNHYIEAHYFEVADLKFYLIELAKNMSQLGYEKESKQIKKFLETEFKKIKGYYKPRPDKENSNIENETVSTSSNSVRDKIVAYATTFIGVKYVWAGSDPSGFDCSGYTSYILKKFNISVTRTASGQMQGASKIKLNNAFKGDLVFFGHSGNITHVGIVISEKGEALSMIHASTSKGIMITNIDTSTYWKPKLKGAGKVV